MWSWRFEEDNGSLLIIFPVLIVLGGLLRCVCIICRPCGGGGLWCPNEVWLETVEKLPDVTTGSSESNNWEGEGERPLVRLDIAGDRESFLSTGSSSCFNRQIKQY